MNILNYDDLLELQILLERELSKYANLCIGVDKEHYVAKRFERLAELRKKLLDLAITFKNIDLSVENQFVVTTAGDLKSINLKDYME